MLPRCTPTVGETVAPRDHAVVRAVVEACNDPLEITARVVDEFDCITELFGNCGDQVGIQSPAVVHAVERRIRRSDTTRRVLMRSP